MHVAWQFAVAIAVCGTLVLVAGCDNPASPTSEAVDRTTTVTFVYRAATTPRADLPASTQECVRGVGHTHIHPSWRSFARIDMMAIAADRWEISFSDVPVGARQSIRVSDGNVCDENATGAATRNVFANNVQLTEIVPTPGSGIEPGLAFTVSASGQVAR
jgi:hypothetical protein